MNSSIQRIAELEAEVASLKAERDALKRKNGQAGIAAITDMIETRLNRVERNLREDFVGKFAGNFLLATETITNRVVTLEERESRLEKQYKQLETGTEKLVKSIIDTVNQQSAKQKEIGQAFCKATDVLLDANEKYIAINKEAAKSCMESARAVSDAARMCLTFKADYEDVAKIAKGNIKELVDDSTLTLRDYFLNIRQSANRAVEPFFNEIGKLKKANRKRTVLYIALGLIAGLVFSTCFAWFTQPQNHIQLDAQKWRVLTSDLTPATQGERVKNLLSEIEKEKKEAENNRNK